MLLDTSGLISAVDADQRTHAACRQALLGTEGRLRLSPFVLAEVDYLLNARVGQDAALAVLDEIGRGAYELETFGQSDVDSAAAVIRRFADLRVGLADASIVVLANRYGDNDVLTLDERHFRVLPGASDRPFKILPADVAD